MPPTRKRLPPRQYAGVSMQGQLVEEAQVLTQGSEWPKIGAVLRVQHGPDQQSLFYLVAVGPLGDKLLDTPVGKTLYVQGQLKAAAGRMEVFVAGLEKPQDLVMGYRSVFGFGGPSAVEGDEWKWDAGEESE